MSGVHSFGLPAKPLKDEKLLSAVGGTQDRVAVGPMSPTIELASSNFHLASQPPEVQIGAAGFGARLAQRPRDRPGARPPDGTNAAEVVATSSAAVEVSLPARSLNSCGG